MMEDIIYDDFFEEIRLLAEKIKDKSSGGMNDNEKT